MNEAFWRDASWLWHTDLDASACTDLLASEARSGVAARVVHADRMTTEYGLFDEWSAALQFPYYFGANWAAFAECVSDLDWLVGERIVVCIFGGDSLAGSQNIIGPLFRALSAAHAELSEPTEWRGPRAFRALIQGATRGGLLGALDELGWSPRSL